MNFLRTINLSYVLLTNAILSCCFKQGAGNCAYSLTKQQETHKSEMSIACKENNFSLVRQWS